MRSLFKCHVIAIFLIMLTCCLLDLHLLLDGDLLAAHVHLVLLALPGLHLAHGDALGVRLEL